MKEIDLSPLQQLGLRTVIRAQQPPTIAALELLQDILEKIDFSEGELRSIANKDGMADIQQVNLLPGKKVQFEKAEVKMIYELLQPSSSFKPTVVDLTWLRPLIIATKDPA